MLVAWKPASIGGCVSGVLRWVGRVGLYVQGNIPPHGGERGAHSRNTITGDA